MLDFFGKFISQRLKNHHVLRFCAEYSRMQFSCWNVEKLTVGTGSSGKFKVDKWVPHILESLNGGSHPLMRTRSFAFRSAYPVASRNEFKERHHQTEPCFWVAASWIFSESFIPQTVNHQFQKISMFWDFRWNGSAVELKLAEHKWSYWKAIYVSIGWYCCNIPEWILIGERCAG